MPFSFIFKSDYSLSLFNMIGILWIIGAGISGVHINLAVIISLALQMNAKIEVQSS